MPKQTIDPVFRQPWAIRPEFLLTLADQAGAAVADQPEGLLGGLSESTDLVEMRGDVAVVHIRGTIYRYRPRFSLHRFTAVETLIKDFQTVVDDPAVKAILLDFDSPGGEASGVHEAAEMIYRARGKKPITAYAGGMACSGAYWLAAAADEVIIDATGEVGSIGVYTVHLDWSKYDEKLGIKEIRIVSSLSPKKNPDPATQAGHDQIQKRLDAVAGVFIADVAQNRKVSVETVRAEFGQGDVVVGQEAVDRGMVDRLGSFEEVLAGLRERKKREVYFMPQQEKTKTRIDRDALVAQHPDLVEAFRAEGRERCLAEGAETERARIRAIEELAGPGREEMIFQAKFETPKSAEELAVEILRAEREATAARAQAVSEDARALEGAAPAAVSWSTAPEEGEKKTEDRRQAASAIAAGGNARRGRTES